MDLTVSLLGIGGDAQLSFTEDHVRITVAKASSREKTAVTNVVNKGLKAGLKLYTVDADGKKNKQLKALPKLGGRKEKQLLLVGPKAKFELIAEGLVAAELDAGNIVMEAQKDGTWKAIRVGEFKAKKEKQAVTSSRPVGGG